MLEIAISFVIGIAGGVVAGVIVDRILNPPGRGRITYPANNARVEHKLSVRGTYRRYRFRSRYYLYLTVKPAAHARYFPQIHEGPIEFDREGNWSSRAFVGLPHEVGDDFSLTLVAVDNEAQKIFEYYGECGAKHDHDYVGLKELPVGSEVLDTISVTRQ